MTPDHRYRICRVCGKSWNVSRLGDSPRRYICPHCAYQAYKKAASRAGTPAAAKKNLTKAIIRPERNNVNE